MTVEIYIGDILIQSIPVDLTGCVCCEEKTARVHGVSEWLKYQYRASIAIHNNWYIMAVKQSKMNNGKSNRHIGNTKR